MIYIVLKSFLKILVIVFEAIEKLKILLQTEFLILKYTLESANLKYDDGTC